MGRRRPSSARPGPSVSRPRSTETRAETRSTQRTPRTPRTPRSRQRTPRVLRTGRPGPMPTAPTRLPRRRPHDHHHDDRRRRLASSPAGRWEAAEPLPAHRLVGRATATYIARLQPQFLADVPSAVAELARLRRGAGRRAHQSPDLWGIGGTDELAGLLDGHEGHIRCEYAEEAVFLAATLWALHQQSSREHGMHSRNHDLGGAVRALIRLKGATSADEEDSPLRKRLVRVGTAESLDSVAVRLREIVLLLRGAKVPLDYARLAGQLYRWQHRPDRAGVQREWGARIPPGRRLRREEGEGGRRRRERRRDRRNAAPGRGLRRLRGRGVADRSPAPVPGPAPRTHVRTTAPGPHARTPERTPHDHRRN